MRGLRLNNTIMLEDCLEEFIQQNELPLNKQDAFELFSTLQITKDSDTSYEEIENSIVDGGLDGGIDSFLFLINDSSISSEDQLDQIKFNEKTEIKIYISQAKLEKSFTEKSIDKLLASLPLILNLGINENTLSSRFNPNLIEKITIFRRILRNSVRKKSQLHIFYTYSCKSDEIVINSALDSKKEQLVTLTKEQLNIKNVAFKLYSSRELLTIYQQSIAEELELTFKETPIPIPFKKNEFGYVGVVNLNDYYDFIMDENYNIRENIFENNIRHYQGDVDVNSNIASSLSADYEKDFWWLNNGITIIASNCRPILKTLYLDDVQIVNGLQTSYTFSKYYTKNSNDMRSILVKVITTSEKPTIDKIISASNSQNPVPPALLRATDDIQRDIETFCLNKGYYYDRRKNYYKNKQKPASKIISIQNMAQSIEAVLNYSPANARSKPTSLIKDEESYNSIFNPHIEFGAFLNSAIIYRKVTNYIKRNIEKSEKGIARNFSYHIARVCATLITNKATYSDRDISIITEEQITDNIINSSYTFILQTIEGYKINYLQENIINISKSNKFVHELNLQLLKLTPCK